MSEKEKRIAEIKERIKTEFQKYGKHETIDWMEITARKLYATFYNEK